MESLQGSVTFTRVEVEIQRRLSADAPHPCFPPALALARIGKPSLLRLVQYLQLEKDWLGREAAIWALGELGNAGVIPTLRGVIRFLGRDRVSKAARVAVRKIRGKS